MYRLRAMALLFVAALLVVSAAVVATPVSADGDPFDPAEEHGFFQKESEQDGSDARPSRSPGDALRPSTAAAQDSMDGLFRIDEGQCGDAGVTSGSYFRMVQTGGTPGDGPFVGNNDSPCGDQSYTPLRPGADGGMSTSGYQPHPDPAFGATGNALNDKITQPQSFLGTDFASATNAVDPQTDTEVPIPQITNDGGTLSGDVRAFAAAWNGNHFNQGAPKPDGGNPGLTQGPDGTFDTATNAYTLDWVSTIVGGAFNNNSGVWHLEGTFDGSVTVGTQAPAGNGGGAGSGDGGGELRGAVSGSGSSGSAAAAQGAGPTPVTGPGTVATVASGFGFVLLAGLARRLGLGPRGG